jgi:hypothetical protein
MGPFFGKHTNKCNEVVFVTGKKQGMRTGVTGYWEVR